MLRLSIVVLLAFVSISTSTVSSSEVIQSPTKVLQDSSRVVYKTKTGSKYHNNGCQYLRSSKIAVSENKAKSQGLTACSVCRTDSKAVSKRSYSVQCSGTTKAGNRCKRKTYNTSGRCYQHD